MARTNVSTKAPKAFTHEGAPAKAGLTPEQKLRRSVMSCLLWEDQFYEDGQEIGARIAALAGEVSGEVLASIVADARRVFGLRHVPLLLAVVMAGRKDVERHLIARTVNLAIGRVDELAEFVSLYWKINPDKMLSRQVRRGLASAFGRFDAYQFAKYDFDKGKAVKLRDVLRLARPVPSDAGQSLLFRAISKNLLAAPDTWETALMRGADKKETFERLISEGRLGYLALLRNLRNMVKAGVDEGLVRRAIVARRGAERVWPFRYVAAARAAPQFEPALDEALVESIASIPFPGGKTVVLVDVSGSMSHPMSSKSDMDRMTAAATLAAVVPGDVRVFTFSNAVVEVPPRRGMAGVDAVVRSQSHGGTELGMAVKYVNGIPHDRLIVITDEQSHDAVPDPVARHAYMINVASYQNGVGYNRWTHIDGFSEAVLRFINERER